MPIEMQFQDAHVQVLHGVGVDNETGKQEPAMQIVVTDKLSGICVKLSWVGAGLEAFLGEIKPSAKIDIMQALPEALRRPGGPL